MLEEKETSLTLDQMREKRTVSEAVFKKFTESKDYYDTHAFCFFEGEDGKYYNPRIEKYWGNNFIALVAGNKKEVLKVMRMIKAEPLYSNVCVMFFVDRDYDDSLAGTDCDLFETPCYSIENLYAQETVIGKILQCEFGLNAIDPDYHKCIADYNLRLLEFCQHIICFNAIVKYQHQYAPTVKCRFSNVKTSHLVRIQIGQVSKASRCDEQITDLSILLNPNMEILKSIESDLRLEPNPLYVFRGKNQLDFMVAMINIFKELNSSGGYFSNQLTNVHINISTNRLSELSQYAITPNELILFLENHRPQNVLNPAE